jgi:hypothetical protein
MPPLATRQTYDPFKTRTEIRFTARKGDDGSPGMREMLKSTPAWVLGSPGRTRQVATLSGGIQWFCDGKKTTHSLGRNGIRIRNPIASYGGYGFCRRK